MNVPHPLPRRIEVIIAALIPLLISLITVAAAYSATKTQVEQQGVSIRDLQQNTVNRREMDDVKEWLRRIDGKLDKALEKK